MRDRERGRSGHWLASRNMHLYVVFVPRARIGQPLSSESEVKFQARPPADRKKGVNRLQ